MKIHQYIFGNKIPKEKQEDFNEKILKTNTRLTTILAKVIVVMELFLLLLSFIPALKTNYEPYRTYYQLLYVILLVASILFVVFIGWMKKSKRLSNKYVEPVIFISGIVILLWGIGITLLDHYRGISSFVYLFFLLVISAVVIMRPFRSMILLFGSLIVFTLMNVLIGIEPTMIFSNLINGITTVITAWIISIFFYNYHMDDYIKQGIIRKQNMALEILSTMDPLTNLFNRRNLDEMLITFYDQALESRKLLTVVMIDIDYYKGYNDTYGHVKGDEVLRIIAKHITTIALKYDGYACRYGGDEICLIFNNDKEQQVTDMLMELRYSIRIEAIENKASLVDDCITISTGYYSDKANHVSKPWNYITKADEALYNEKSNRVMKNI